MNLNAFEARRALDEKSTSAVELANAYLAAAEATSELNNYVELTADHALAMAAESDKRIKEGTAGLLEGLPIGVKDLFCTKDIKQYRVFKNSERFCPAL